MIEESEKKEEGEDRPKSMRGSHQARPNGYRTTSLLQHLLDSFLEIAFRQAMSGVAPDRFAFLVLNGDSVVHDTELFHLYFCAGFLDGVAFETQLVLIIFHEPIHDGLIFTANRSAGDVVKGDGGLPSL